jgi:hypothetical protein
MIAAVTPDRSLCQEPPEKLEAGTADIAGAVDASPKGAQHPVTVLAGKVD